MKAILSSKSSESLVLLYSNFCRFVCFPSILDFTRIWNCNEPVWYKIIYPFFFSPSFVFLSFFQSDFFYLLTVGTEVYCYTRSHSAKHTLDRTPLDEGSALRRDFYYTQHTSETDIHAPAGIRIRDPWKRAAADPHLKEDNSVMELPPQILVIMRHVT
jgi:hypothetical protein